MDAPVIIHPIQNDPEWKGTIQRYQHTEQEFKFSVDRLNCLVEKYIPLLTSVQEVNDLIDVLPETYYRGLRKLHELAITMESTGDIVSEICRRSEEERRQAVQMIGETLGGS